ncbi:MAG: MBL fold metallo-hydrolase [Candidatus Omnitrophica bacterium]|nr:MBL fold metallo-hydrolase [Candidatus Omnitrophota bacterium]
MSAVKISNNIYWVGAVDWNIRNFHGYTYETQRGTTYNAYLILDDKITLVDTVLDAFSAQFIENIKNIVDPRKIDYIIANHLETDHTGSLPEILKYCPQAKIFATNKCIEGLKQYYKLDSNFEAVKTKDKLNIGKRNLTFITAPMLHWPDSMFSYINEDKLLLSNDAFGQHYATSKRFDDQVNSVILEEEAAKYYGNILWPFSSIAYKKIQEISEMNIELDMIAPAHGLIWRKNPKKIIDLYLRWSEHKTKKKVVVIYETMWGSTAKMAEKITEAIADNQVEVSLFDINKSKKSDIIGAMLEAEGFVVGSSTHDNDLLPNLSGFLKFLEGLKPKKRKVAVFGSFGWAGGATGSIAKLLKDNLGLDLVQPELAIKHRPCEEDLKKCYQFGKDFVAKLSN